MIIEQIYQNITLVLNHLLTGENVWYLRQATLLCIYFSNFCFLQDLIKSQEAQWLSLLTKICRLIEPFYFTIHF